MVTVNNVAPTLAVTPSANLANEGSEISFNAAFSDPGFDNPLNPGTEKAESFTYDVNWGDGRDAIVGMSVADTNGAPGVFSTGMFSGSHIYADDGVYTVTVTIHDDNGGSFVEQFMVTVENVAPTLTTPNGNQTLNEGALLSLANLGTFTDPGFDNPLNPGGETGRVVHLRRRLGRRPRRNHGHEHRRHQRWPGRPVERHDRRLTHVRRQWHLPRHRHDPRRRWRQRHQNLLGHGQQRRADARGHALTHVDQ